MPIGLIHYPGIVNPRSANFTFSAHGTSPSSAIIEIVPQAAVPATVGDLEFTFGGTRVKFGDCHLDMSSFTRNSSGLIMSLRVLDRRWRWREKTITGSYNLRNQDETIDVDTEKTPHQLAKFLLDAMGEVGYDVTALPLEPRPLVQWEFTSAAHELDTLCDTFGCRAVLCLDGRVRIRVLGVGADLPDLPQVLSDASGSIDPPEIPDLLRVVFGPTRVQLIFATEAVALDTDKKIKSIDAADLSYRPAGGWGRADLGQLLGIPGPTPPIPPGEQDTSPRSLALKSVFRWYRINGIVGDTTERFLKRLLGTYFDFRIGTYATDPMKQFLPLLSDLVDIDPATKKNLEPFVAGVYAKMNGVWSNSAPWETYRKEFTIQNDKGIIEFKDYVFKWTTAGQPSRYSEADVFLVASCNIKHHTSMAVHRVLRDLTTGANSGLGAKVYREEDVAGTIRMHYQQAADTTNNASAANSTTADTNLRAINQEADYHLTAAMAEFQVKAAVDNSYVGLVPIPCDGAIQQVTYTVQQGAGCTTRASRNSEYHLYRPTYKQRVDVRKVQWNNLGLLRASIRQGNRQLRGF